MRVIPVVSAALLGVGALTFSAPAAFAAGGGDSHSYGSDSGSHSYGGGGGDSRSDDGDGSGGRSGGGGGGEDRGRGGDSRSEDSDDEGRSGGGGHKREHFQHGVRAGEGGTIAGFDLKEIGMGTALIGGSVGAAYYLSRRRTGEEGVA
ncbi:hypothetical protein [Streptomyces naganishii]|uniref:Integral membrane protein n=1 Tax=Streptomyces naganishii JCM 4654 TaxID=1306179 RepID=A0A918Y3M6_9ACTN|nr:hypothetical protein [Streptomyces naganishii]GHD88069.1 hypothetical protein GCM10010508_22620 [Streptomyces naganishii JCM 4654]